MYLYYFLIRTFSLKNKRCLNTKLLTAIDMFNIEYLSINKESGKNINKYPDRNRINVKIAN